MSLSFAILGAGVVGGKRGAALVELGCRVTTVHDIDAEKSRALAERLGAMPAESADRAIESAEAVIVATTNDSLAPLAIRAIQRGRHVLVEKPCGRNPAEVRAIVESRARAGSPLVVKAGFNLRHHPSLIQARELLGPGGIGRLLFIRARYGHGGRFGYEREWRADPEVAGGGEWLDQGCHLVDLCRCLAGDFQHAIGYCDRFFWNMPVEDNAFVILKNTRGQVAQLHASCTEWKNGFSMEIFGETGKLEISGLGGSYGPESLTWYRMRPEMGPPDRTVFDFASEKDDSWKRELREMLAAIDERRSPQGDIEDALRAIEIIFDVYAWDREHNPARFAPR